MLSWSALPWARETNIGSAGMDNTDEGVLIVAAGAGVMAVTGLLMTVAGVFLITCTNRPD